MPHLPSELAENILLNVPHLFSHSDPEVARGLYNRSLGRMLLVSKDWKDIVLSLPARYKEVLDLSKTNRALNLFQPRKPCYEWVEVTVWGNATGLARLEQVFPLPKCRKFSLRILGMETPDPYMVAEMVAVALDPANMPELDSLWLRVPATELVLPASPSAPPRQLAVCSAGELEVNLAGLRCSSLRLELDAAQDESRCCSPL